MKKKTMLKLAGMMIVTALLAGCGNDTADKADESSQAASEKTEASAENADDNEASDAKDTQEEAQAEASVEIDAKGLAERLRNEIAYQDDLSEVDLETAGMFLSFSDAGIDEAYIYESSGATAEEIVVIKGSSAEDADKLKSALENRVSEQKEAYEDYVPEELNKLSEAVIAVKDNTVILSVSDEPEKAKEIIGN
ncbi:MAG: DUF4358 domain-containing protein [Lachnospiraceae bacterium]|nr:DUF4358 domain-containing protein [Lachnospiraceae bacterium]